jgi:hypothetical protein
MTIWNVLGYIVDISKCTYLPIDEQDVLQCGICRFWAIHLLSGLSRHPEATQTSNTNTSNHWQEFEETALLDHLTNNVSAAGDSLTFPKHVWKSASEHVNACPAPPGSKMRSNKPPASCKNKWAALKAAYHQVQFIKSTSGLTWSDEDGVGVSPENKDVWNELVKVSIL